MDLFDIDIFIILGDCGCGKSTILNKLFNLNFESNNNSNHVTKNLDEKFTLFKNKKIKIIDTPGFDLNERNFINLKDYLDQKIVLVYLSSNYRFNTYCEIIAKKLSINLEDINVYNCFYMLNDKVKDYNELFNDFNNNKMSIIKLKSEKIKNEKIKLNSENRNYELKNINNDIKKITQYRAYTKDEVNYSSLLEGFDIQMIKQYRNIGDAYLKLCCEIQNFNSDINYMTVNTNIFLKKYMIYKIRNLNNLLKKYYINESNLTDERIADVLEALIGYCLLENKLTFDKMTKRQKKIIKLSLIQINYY